MAGAASTGTPASRRGPSKGDLKEQEILEAAERLLDEKPIHEVGVDEMAHGADISRSAFYFYFESKYAVLQALVDRVVHRTYEAASRALSRDDQPPDQSIRESIEASAEHWRAHGPVLRAAVQTWGTVPEMGRFWEGITAGFVEAAAAKIQRERRAGAAPPGGPSPKALATALIWMNERCFYTASIGAAPALGQQQLVDTLTTVWLRAVYCADRASSEGSSSEGPSSDGRPG